MNDTYTLTPTGNTGIGVTSPAAKLHIVGNRSSFIGTYEITFRSRIAEETWEEIYDICVDGEFKKTITRKEFYRNFLLVPDPENPDDWHKLIIGSDGNVGIGA
ncbi:MAG: hypothetical protein E3J60_04700 [Dehalococcoidia bacterium]|nr:MAG: hypothetical protein E3J60_04700 [Dehalococcoidia bacterium]